MTRIKVCCISSLEEARTAINMGAHALGLVGPMPSGPGIISNELIAEIAHAVRDEDVRTFLLTSETEADAIIAHYRKCKTTTIQLVDAVENEVYAKLRSSLPEVELVQVIHVLDENSIIEALEKAAFVDYILLDSGNPNLQTKELGGTGRTHNWSISKKIVEKCPVPVFLAGGLHPGNIAEAKSMVGPYGFDLCSGIRSEGKLDQEKITEFFNSANGSN